jgi:hypothetical protein
MTPPDSQPEQPLAAGQDLVASSEVLSSEVPSSELNAWRRGFTPQAEIWNGRLAMLGLSVGLAVLLLVRLASH